MLNDLVAAMGTHVTVFGGKLPGSFKEDLKNAHIPFFDFLDDDMLLAGQIDTSTQLLTKHYSFSSGIDERLFVNEEERVYATSYLLKGQNVASTYQFWATDSVNHFLRGSLYIDCVPNNDSLAPVLEYLQQDMDHLIETLKWK